jgi:hypothetical protein
VHRIATLAAHTKPVTTRKAPGQALIEELNAALPPGVEWTKIERTTLDSIRVMANRLAALRKRADAAIADPQASAQQISMLANAARHWRCPCIS